MAGAGVRAETLPTTMTTAPIFDGWQAESIDGMVARCRDLVEDLTFPTVESWRERGGKTVGHFQVYFPEEIAHAAGLLPVKVRGAQVEPQHADSHFGSYLCSILKTSLELHLSGRLKLDLFVSHPICDAARNLAAVWGRNADYPCRLLMLPQNANSRHAASFLRGEYQALLVELEAIAGRQVSGEDLRRSLAVFNENRRLLRRLYALKREQPWLLAVEEAYVLASVGGLVPREEHNALLWRALELIADRPARRQDKIRVVFAGGFCEQPPLDLLHVVSRTCYVVEDDLLVGLRWLEEDVRVDGDPLAALAEAYFEHSSWSPVQHDRRKPKEEMLLDWVRRSRADAVILTAAKMCEPGLEDQVAFAGALDHAGVPYFVSEFEENMASFDHLAMQLETFVENLLFD
jgi:benzoyl-CoA reductase subunit C